MPEIMDEFSFASLEAECLKILGSQASRELQNRVDNDPPLRLHVRAAPPKPERLRELKICLEQKQPIPENLTPKRWLAPMIDHTLLRASATHTDLERHCQEARENDLGAVCVNPTMVAASKSLLQGSKVGIVSVVGFPTGCHSTSTKVEESKYAIGAGAQELDMVLSIGELRSQDFDFVFQDILAVVKAADPHPVKVILECSELDQKEKVIAAWLARAAGAHFVKTSTGFSPRGGADPRDVALLRFAVGTSVGIKASGGVKNLSDAINMILAGADRIGSSTGPAWIGEK